MRCIVQHVDCISLKSTAVGHDVAAHHEMHCCVSSALPEQMLQLLACGRKPQCAARPHTHDVQYEVFVRLVAAPIVSCFDIVAAAMLLLLLLLLLLLASCRPTYA
jgi:hypothetical protein